MPVLQVQAIFLRVDAKVNSCKLKVQDMRTNSQELSKTWSKGELSGKIKDGPSRMISNSIIGCPWSAGDGYIVYEHWQFQTIKFKLETARQTLERDGREYEERWESYRLLDFDLLSALIPLLIL